MEQNIYYYVIWKPLTGGFYKLRFCVGSVDSDRVLLEKRTEKTDIAFFFSLMICLKNSPKVYGLLNWSSILKCLYRNALFIWKKEFEKNIALQNHWTVIPDFFSTVELVFNSSYREINYIFIKIMIFMMEKANSF